ncbi:hypothetical protein HaLaN_20134 [Haematococcus lacustris]|uniref:Uncharacterized protein n=1 Tax=Haematococcus lacustris TaxID=44745 RepID=A0A699ZSC8_HAELA|nr:hypothetical protein HaLaN_20134 [Haematococcus lacustris]
MSWAACALDHKQEDTASLLSGQLSSELPAALLEAPSRAGAPPLSAPSLEPAARPASAGHDVVPGSSPPQAPTGPTQQPVSHTGSSLRAWAQHSPTTKRSKRSKRTKVEPAAEPTKGKGKAAKAKPAPQPGRPSCLHCEDGPAAVASAPAPQLPGHTRLACQPSGPHRHSSMVLALTATASVASNIQSTRLDRSDHKTRPVKGKGACSLRDAVVDAVGSKAGPVMFFRQSLAASHCTPLLGSGEKVCSGEDQQPQDTLGMEPPSPSPLSPPGLPAPSLHLVVQQGQGPRTASKVGQCSGIHGRGTVAQHQHICSLGCRGGADLTGMQLLALVSAGVSRYEASGAMPPRKRPSAAEQEPLPIESPRKQGPS